MGVTVYDKQALMARPSNHADLALDIHSGTCKAHEVHDQLGKIATANVVVPMSIPKALQIIPPIGTWATAFCMLTGCTQDSWCIDYWHHIP